MSEDTAKQDALFVNLILVFKSAAMQQMGKLMNPVTGETDRNLDQARFSIDTLEMLKDKTRGNLSEDLARLLDSTLLELRMNYVEEAEAEAKAAEAGEREKPEPEPTAEAGPQDRGEEPASSEGGGKTKRGDAPAAGSEQSTGPEMHGEAAQAGLAGSEAASGGTAADSSSAPTGKSKRSGRPRKGGTGKGADGGRKHPK